LAGQQTSVPSLHAVRPSWPRHVPRLLVPSGCPCSPLRLAVPPAPRVKRRRALPASNPSRDNPAEGARRETEGVFLERVRDTGLVLLDRPAGRALRPGRLPGMKGPEVPRESASLLWRAGERPQKRAFAEGKSLPPRRRSGRSGLAGTPKPALTRVGWKVPGYRASSFPGPGRGQCGCGSREHTSGGRGGIAKLSVEFTARWE
jgi:hypothetical protein